MEENNMMSNLPAVLTVLLLLGIGIVMTFYTKRIQKLSTMDKWGPLTGPTLGTAFMRKYIESPLYIFELRMGGILAFVFAGVLVYDLLFH